MTRYAVLDTCHLIELSAMLEAKLDELGRTEWAAEEFQRLEQVRWEGGRQDEEPWLRVKGIRELDPRGLAVLRELAQIRDEAARQLDRPLFRVMRDEALVGLASSAASGGRLSDVRGVPRAWLRGVQREALESAVERGRQRAERDAPVLPTRPRGPRRTREHEARLRRMRRERDRIAEQLDLEPSILASRAVLEGVISRLDEGGSLEQVADLRHWQRVQLGPVFDVARG
jgi:ribonuclease D